MFYTNQYHFPARMAMHPMFILFFGTEFKRRDCMWWYM